MDKELAELQTAYDLASYNLNKSLIKITIFSQHELAVPETAYAESLGKIQTVREILNQLDTWLQSQVHKEQ
jgi:hypothetical protein